ncbi:MAG: nucleotidyl transferase AbiEii/AbiGii toxin family protein [Oscillospiraceae bacterium]|nr:nucleotidyl transferase AbiEii/AbiGii toxin family protein [Oscillospiraceae bacterium]
MAVKNMEASVLARLKTQAKEEGIPFQMVLQLFAQEEFLRKLALSEYAENMILKGGMFIYTLTEFESRPTRDIDFLIRNFHGSLENMERTMRKICGINTGNDFITLEVLKPEPISSFLKIRGGLSSEFSC